MSVYLGVSNFMMNFHTELGVYTPADAFNRVLGGKWRVQSMNRHMGEITELPSRRDVAAVGAVGALSSVGATAWPHRPLCPFSACWGHGYWMAPAQSLAMGSGELPQLQGTAHAEGGRGRPPSPELQDHLHLSRLHVQAFLRRVWTPNQSTEKVRK